jgi:glycine cleavage system aminomethyltransferase T
MTRHWREKFTSANLINGTITSSPTSDIYPGNYGWPVNWDEPEIRLDYNFDGKNKMGNKKDHKKDKAKLFNLTWFRKREAPEDYEGQGKRKGVSDHSGSPADQVGEDETKQLRT